MAIEKNNTSSQNCMKDTVCIQTEKVFDMCKDKECLENIRVQFSGADQAIVDKATSVKFRKAEIIWVSSDVEALPFNKGYYSVDICFYFRINLEVCSCMCKSSYIDGLATYTKKVILFGSEGSAYVFTSTYKPCSNDLVEPMKTNLPKAIVETVDPIALSAKIIDVCCDCDCDCDGDSNSGCCGSEVPEYICSLFDCGFTPTAETKRIYVTLGIFVIVRLQRSVQLLVPSYDYCIPEKDCVSTSDDDPCTLFEKIKFPFEEFYPPKGSCGCDHRSC